MRFNLPAFLALLALPVAAQSQLAISNPSPALPVGWANAGFENGVNGGPERRLRRVLAEIRDQGLATREANAGVLPDQQRAELQRQIDVAYSRYNELSRSH